MSGHALHVAAHELDVLEAFVHDCIQQLPRLQSVTSFATTANSTAPPPLSPSKTHSHQNNLHLPARCAAYHTTCAAMLRQALVVLTPLSPRLARLVAQIWELASLNVFALLQLAHAVLSENDALLAQCEHSMRFQAESNVQDAERAARVEREREQLRVEAQQLRAELHTTKQRANRLAVEKTQLRRVLSSLLDGPLEPANAADRLSNASSGGGSRVVNEFVEDVAAVGAPEEQELYGVDGDTLDAVEVAHPLERTSADLDQVLNALVEGEARHVAVLNDMDRFINSNAVGLLWRYGSTEQQHQLMERMLRSRHASTQTTGDVVVRRNTAHQDRSVDKTDNDSDAEKEGDDDSDDDPDALASSGASGHAAVVTCTRAIPPTLRAQLESRPKIHRVLEQRDVAQLILALYVDKLDADATAVRAKQPRVPLHRFLKQAFLVRYGIASLADYHLMELVKSCLFHHERRRRAIATSTSTPNSGGGIGDCLLVALTPTERPHQVDADEVRIALFARVCELVPFELPSPNPGSASASTSTAPGSVAAGNLFTTAFHALIDLLGDIIELDPVFASLNDVERIDNYWWCPLERATLLATKHLAYVGRDAVADLTARLAALSGPIPGTSSRSPSSSASSAQRISNGIPSKAVIAVDVMLALFATAWFEYDQRLTTKLRDGFRRQLMLISPLALSQVASSAGKSRATTNDSNSRSRPMTTPELDAASSVSDASSASFSTSPPIETLMRAFASLPDESLAPTVLEELRSTLTALLDTKQQQTQQLQQAPARGRRATKKMPSMAHLTGASVCIGGVSEKEFVFHALEVLRSRRVCYGLRTNGRRLVRRYQPLDGEDDNGSNGDTNRDGTNKAIWPVESDADGLVPVALDELKPGLTRREG